MLRRVAAFGLVGVPAATLVASRIYRERNRPNLLTSYDQTSLAGRTVVISGGTSGIGRAVATDMVKLGATVVIGSRDTARGEAARTAILTAASTAEKRVMVLPLDTSDGKSVAAFAGQIAATYGEVDVVVAAAAEIHTARSATASGVDLGLATNHLGIQGLVCGLEPALRRAGNADSSRRPRVVIVGSRLEQRGGVDVDALRASGGAHLRASAGGEDSDAFNPISAYANTKHANMLLLTHLAERWRGGDGAGPIAEVFAVTPGMVDTGLWRNFPFWYRAVTYPIRAVALRSAEDAAAGIVFAVTATALDGQSGAYLGDGVEVEPSEGSRDQDKAQKLFEICQVLISKDIDYRKVKS